MDHRQADSPEPFVAPNSPSTRGSSPQLSNPHRSSSPSIWGSPSSLFSVLPEVSPATAYKRLPSPFDEPEEAPDQDHVMSEHVRPSLREFVSASQLPSQPQPPSPPRLSLLPDVSPSPPSLQSPPSSPRRVGTRTNDPPTPSLPLAISGQDTSTPEILLPAEHHTHLDDAPAIPSTSTSDDPPERRQRDLPDPKLITYSPRKRRKTSKAPR